MDPNAGDGTTHMSLVSRAEFDALKSALKEERDARINEWTPYVRSVVVAYWRWLPPSGIFGSHHFARGDDHLGVVYATSFGLLGLGWALDALLIPAQCSRSSYRLWSLVCAVYSLMYAWMCAVVAESLATWWSGTTLLTPVWPVIGATLGLLVAGQMHWAFGLLVAVPWTIQLAMHPPPDLKLSAVPNALWMVCVVTRQRAAVVPVASARRLRARRLIPRLAVLGTALLIFVAWYNSRRVASLPVLWEHLWIRATEHTTLQHDQF